MLEEDKEKLDTLLKEFLIGQDCNPDEAIKKINNLKNMHPKETVSVLNFFAHKETQPKILLHIVQMLGKYRDKSSIPVLIEILTDYKNPQEQEKYLKVRCKAADILGEIKDDSAVVPLMYIMNDKNEYYKIRLAVAEALGKIGNAYAVNPLINIVTDEEEKSVYLRESAAKALGMIGDERAVDPLISIIETKNGIMDKFTFLKERTIEALGKLGFNKEKKLKALKNVLLDESPQIRVSAMEALCEIDDEEVPDLLQKMMFDVDEDVARNSINALYNVCGRGYVIDLLRVPNLPDCCRAEINDILEEEDEDDDCEDDEEYD
jgi:HEAT repeat protein